MPKYEVILKALEHCSKNSTCPNDCPFDEFLSVSQCHYEFLDGFKRLLAENEQLKAEIDRLQKVEKENFYKWHKSMIDIKQKAVKTFAERLCEDRVSNDPVVVTVKAKLKEMECD